MTARSIPTTHGEAGEPMPITSREFAVRCRALVAANQGHDAHRAMDELTNELLTSLGYGEGVEVFKAAVAATHTGDGSYSYWARGERNGLAKLDPDKVREIRQSTERPAALAVRFGVSAQTISYVRTRRIWRHIP